MPNITQAMACPKIPLAEDESVAVDGDGIDSGSVVVVGGDGLVSGSELTSGGDGFAPPLEQVATEVRDELEDGLGRDMESGSLSFTFWQVSPKKPPVTEHEPPE